MKKKLLDILEDITYALIPLPIYGFLTWVILKIVGGITIL